MEEKGYTLLEKKTNKRFSQWFCKKELRALGKKKMHYRSSWDNGSKEAVRVRRKQDLVTMLEKPECKHNRGELTGRHVAAAGPRSVRWPPRVYTVCRNETRSLTLCWTSTAKLPCLLSHPSTSVSTAPREACTCGWFHSSGFFKK